MKRVLVVGGANGIGFSTALQLAKDNEVTIADFDKKRLIEISQKNANCNFILSEMDLTSDASRNKLIQSLQGKIDVLILSAAIHMCHPVEYLSEEMIDNVLDVNLIAQIKFIKKMLPHIEDGGRIVGISSIAAGIGVPMESLYSASKAGLEGFFECLAAELKHRKIHVSIIHPGNVNTGFNEKGNAYKATGHAFIDKGYERVVSSIDSSKGMPPEKVAQMIVRTLKSKKPRFFNAVGMNAIKAHWAKRLLGNNLALKLMTSYFGF